jgi:protoheme ferro-lyase
MLCSAFVLEDSEVLLSTPLEKKVEAHRKEGELFERVATPDGKRF